MSIPCTKSSIPPLEVNNEIYTDENDKANILNIFQSQAVLNERTPHFNTLHNLVQKVGLTEERIKRKYLFPFALSSTSPYERVLFLYCTKKQIYVLFPQKVSCLLYLTIDVYICPILAFCDISKTFDSVAFGILDFCINFRKLVLLEMPYIGSRVILLTENELFSSQVLYLNGNVFELMSQKGLFVIFQKIIIPCANVISGLTESRQTH